MINCTNLRTITLSPFFSTLTFSQTQKQPIIPYLLSISNNLHSHHSLSIASLSKIVPDRNRPIDYIEISSRITFLNFVTIAEVKDD